MEASRWRKSDDSSTLLKHRSFFRKEALGDQASGRNFSRQTALENEAAGRNGEQEWSDSAPLWRTYLAGFAAPDSALESGGWGSQGRKSEHLA